MREIKFKLFFKGKFVGWQRETTIHSYKELWTIQSQYSKDGTEWSYDLYIMHDDKKQYTGRKLKDKEIYEGDILGGGDELGNGFVEWSSNQIAFILRWYCEDGSSETPLLSDEISGYSEIIGNIHENPELLEEIKYVLSESKM